MALVAAVIAMAFLSMLALALASSRRAMTLTASGEATRARLAAAADAGLALAVHAIARDNPAQRWPIDGRPLKLDYNGLHLDIRIEDERGKIPLNFLDDDQAQRLFIALGASGERLKILTDSFLDWRDEDDERRDHGAEAADYQGIQPPNGEILSVQELANMRGMDAALMEKLLPVATTWFGRSGSIDAATLSATARYVLYGKAVSATQQIEDSREESGQRTAFALESDPQLVGRPLTVRVMVRDDSDGRFERASVIELTGRPSRPYVVRQSS